MDFRERIETSRKNQDSSNVVKIADSNNEQEEILDFNFFAVDNMRNQLACVDMRMADGSRKAIVYSYIMEISFDASEGIEIVTAAKQIRITGRDLGRLYDYLMLFRVKYIQANIGADLNEGGLFVKGITIKEL